MLKNETWYIQEGAFQFDWIDGERAERCYTQLQKGDVVYIQKGLPHQLTALSDNSIVFEVLVQRAIDAINGIDITNPIRQYSETITKDKQPGRNERVMLQGPAGEMEFVKNKKVDSYLQKGWNLI